MYTYIRWSGCIIDTVTLFCTHWQHCDVRLHSGPPFKPVQPPRSGLVIFMVRIGPDQTWSETGPRPETVNPKPDRNVFSRLRTGPGPNRSIRADRKIYPYSVKTNVHSYSYTYYIKNCTTYLLHTLCMYDTYICMSLCHYTKVVHRVICFTFN